MKNIKYPYSFLLGMLTAAGIFVFAHPVFAAVKLEVPINNHLQVEDLPEYIELMYNFALSVIGIVATVMMMWGGFKWIAAAGNSSKIGDAKDSIYSALIGLILALLSFSLLFVINPLLLRNANPTVTPPNIAGYDNLASVPKCTDVAPQTDGCYLEACSANTCNFNNKGKQDVCRKSYCGGVDKVGGLVQTCQESPTGSGVFKCISEKGASESCDNPKNEGAKCEQGKVCTGGKCVSCSNQRTNCSSIDPCCGYDGLTCENGSCQKTLKFKGEACSDPKECVSGICDAGKCVLVELLESCSRPEQCYQPPEKTKACVNSECCILNGNLAEDPNSGVSDQALCCTKTVDTAGKCANP